MIKIENIGILEFGHTVDMVGVIYRGGPDETYLLYFPGEDMVAGDKVTVVDVEDWPALLRQTDLLESRFGFIQWC